MTDIQELKRLCQIECRSNDAEWESYQQLSSRDMLALLDRLEAAERDAVRYKKLRARSATEFGTIIDGMKPMRTVLFLQFDPIEIADHTAGHNPDAAIDALTVKGKK